MKQLPILLGGLLVALANCLLLARGAEETADPALAWKRTESSIALLNRGKTVWRFVFDPKQNKSYFHPLGLVDGTVLTELRPADHVWHYAGWFSWKFINGLNYWEEDPRTGQTAGCTQITDVVVETGDDFSAKIELTLSYHPPERAELLSEKRTLRVQAPKAEGSYHIDWQSEFVAKGKEVILDRTPLPGQLGGAGHGGYAGLSIRAARAHVPWDFLDSEGRVNEAHGKQARWVNHSGKTAGGGEAGLTIFDHPDNVGHPSHWYLAKRMPYFSPAVIFSAPLTLAADERLELKYRILVQARKGEAAELERHYSQFVEACAKVQDDARPRIAR